MVFLQFFFSLFIGDSLAISSLHSRWNLPSLSPILQIKNAERSTRRLSLFCRLSVEVTPTVLLSEKSPKPLKCFPGDGFNPSFSTFQKHRIREILACGIRNPWNFYLWNLESWAPGIRNPTKDWNLKSSTWNPESTTWNPETKTVFDSFAWGDSFSLPRRHF